MSTVVNGTDASWPGALEMEHDVAGLRRCQGGLALAGGDRARSQRCPCARIEPVVTVCTPHELDGECATTGLIDEVLRAGVGETIARRGERLLRNHLGQPDAPGQPARVSHRCAC